MKALDGITVLEANAGLAGAIAGLLLADHGAQVIKLDTGDAAFSIWNRGKSIVAAGEFARRYDEADVLLIGSAAEPGGDRPVTCTITGYGRTGPLAGRPADDALVAARLGLCASQPGWLDGPSHLVHPLPSIGAALLAVQGICAALLERTASGHAIDVETSLLGGVLAMSTRVAGAEFPPGRSWYWKANGPFPFYSAFACADGAWLQLGCIHDGFVRSAIAALGIDDPVMTERAAGPDSPLETDPAEAQYRLLAEAFATRSRAEWLAMLDAADVPCAPVQASADYLRDPQAIVNGIIEDPTPQIGPAVRLSGVPGTAGDPVRRDGQQAVDRQPDSSVASSDAAAPLRGVRVLEIANLIAGPMSARLLADLGAEVIKLEPTDGGDIARRNRSPAFYPLNSGKRGIAVNLRTDAGRRIGQELAAWADVIIDNMRPGVSDRLGLGWETLRERHPRLIYCHVSAFGFTGPYAHRPGLDPLAAALAGVEMEQGAGSGRPVYLQAAAVDHTAALLAAYGVLLALIDRSRTGRGQKVETSLLDAAALINAPAISTPELVERPASQFGLHALVRLYRAADGWFALAARTERAWQALRSLLNDPETFPEHRFGTAELRRIHDAALTARLEAVFATRPVAEWLAELAARSIPAEPVLAGDDPVQLGAPHLAANGQVVEHDHPVAGPLRIAHGWLAFTGARTAPPRPAPALGEQTREVLTELGYAPETIAAWLADGVIAEEVAV